MKISEYFEIKSEMKIFIQLKFAANVSKKSLKSMNRIQNSMSRCYLFDSI